VSGRDEYGDPRYSDGHDNEGEGDGERCPGGTGDSTLPFGPGYLDNLLALEDARVKEGSLDLLVPDLSDRWPEPRLLAQTELWFARGRTPASVADLDGDGARRLLGAIHALASNLHRVAARDEALTTSSGARWAMAAAGVPTIAELDPHAWLESTVLVRALRDRCR